MGVAGEDSVIRQPLFAAASSLISHQPPLLLPSPCTGRHLGSSSSDRSARHRPPLDHCASTINDFTLSPTCSPPLLYLLSRHLAPSIGPARVHHQQLHLEPRLLATSIIFTIGPTCSPPLFSSPPRTHARASSIDDFTSSPMCLPPPS